MPSGGARPGAGRPKKEPETAPPRQVKPAAQAKKRTPAKKAAKESPFVESVILCGEQKIGVPCDYKEFRAAFEAWLASKGVLGDVDPGLVFSYCLNMARMLQYEQVATIMGFEERNINSGAKYELPSSRAAREYAKRADAARQQIYDIIRSKAESGAVGDSAMMQLLGGGVPAWRKK